MDQDRQIRFVIPPFLLLASLVWGAHLGDKSVLALLTLDSSKILLGLFTLAAVVVVPVGFLISLVTVLVFSALAMINRQQDL